MSSVEDRIHKLVDEIRILADTEENQRRLSLFKKSHLGVDKHLPGPRKGKTFPVIICPEKNLWANILGFRLYDYYTNPMAYLEAQLRMILAQWQELPDDRPIDKLIIIRFGVALVPSLWGARVVFSEKDNPWHVVESPVKSAAELEARGQINFETSGLMPQAHHFYEDIRKILPEDFKVEFILWDFSPLGVANMLYGQEQFLMQLLLDPEDAAQALAHAAEIQGAWYKTRAEFLNEPLNDVTLGEDDVATPVISPDIYRNLILPSELRLKELCTAISYWHSCGDTTPFFEDIARTEPWLMDISYVSSQERVCKIFPSSVALEANLSGISILAGDFDSQIARAKEANDLFAGRCSYFTLAGLAPRRTSGEDLLALKEFMSRFHAVFSSFNNG